MYLDRDVEVKEGSSLGYFTDFEMIFFCLKAAFPGCVFSQNVIPVVGVSKVKKLKIP